MKRNDCVRNGENIGSGQRAKFVGRTRADQDVLQLMLVVQGHDP